MSQFNMQTIEGVKAALAAGATTSQKLVEETRAVFDADSQSELPLNAFLEIYDDAILRAQEADQLRAQAAAEGEVALKKLLEEKPLLGVPFAVKDNTPVPPDPKRTQPAPRRHPMPHLPVPPKSLCASPDQPSQHLLKPCLPYHAKSCLY